VKPRIPGSPRSASGAGAHLDRQDLFGSSVREAADSGPVAQAVAGLVVLLLCLFVVFVVLWPAWSFFWARLAAAIAR
jgi:hypothetical protein